MRFVGQCERAKPKIGWERKLVPADDSAEGDVYGTYSWVGAFGFTFGFVCYRRWWWTLTDVHEGTGLPLHKFTRVLSPPPPDWLRDLGLGLGLGFALTRT